jgi:trehalose 2-sulfotransferase
MTFRSYLICATPRSGSTLLCDLLTATGAAGRPQSYFRKQDLADWSRRFGVAPEPDPGDFGIAYLDAVLEQGTAGVGVFGCRLMWETLEEIQVRFGVLFPGLAGDAARIERAFGPTLYVRLSRADKVAQAVSLVKAEQSGLWHRNSDGTPREGPDRPQPTFYDAASIAELVDALQRQDAAWDAWFADNGIAAVRIGYDALVADPREAAAAVLSALGLERALAAKVRPRTAKLADDESLTWARRFRAEQASNPS